MVDASALIEAVAAREPSPALVSRLAAAELHAPELIEVEVLHVLRRLVRGRRLPVDAAEEALSRYEALLPIRYSHRGLADRIWSLRDNLNAYDAVYVALAEALDMPLVTVDTRLRRAGAGLVEIEVY